MLNQEWNRIEVRFNNKLFPAKGLGTEQQVISRVDIANNCLAKGRWEILAFTAENGNDLLYFQCWFDFPDELYNRLFFKRNGMNSSKYDDMRKNYSHRKGETETKWKTPVSIAGNGILNLAKLNDNPNVVDNDHQNETTGYRATFETGKLKAAKDYLLSVTCAHVEKYSVLDYFAQDDWMRWGFSGGAGGSNFKGLELRAAYAFGPNLNLVARTYLIKGIAPNKPEATLETNHRFRLDLNVAF